MKIQRSGILWRAPGWSAEEPFLCHKWSQACGDWVWLLAMDHPAGKGWMLEIQKPGKMDWQRDWGIWAFRFSAPHPYSGGWKPESFWDLPCSYYNLSGKRENELSGCVEQIDLAALCWISCKSHCGLKPFCDLCGPSSIPCDEGLLSKHSWGWMDMEIEVVPIGQGEWTAWTKVVLYPCCEDRIWFLMLSAGTFHCQ